MEFEKREKIVEKFKNSQKTEQESILKSIINKKFVDINKEGFHPSDIWEFVFDYRLFDEYPDLKAIAEEKMITAGDIGLIHCYIRDKKEEGTDNLEIYSNILKAAEKSSATAYALLTGVGQYITSCIKNTPNGRNPFYLIEEYLLNSNDEKLIKKYLKDEYCSHRLKDCQINSTRLLSPITKLRIINNNVLVQTMRMDTKAITIFSDKDNVLGTHKKRVILLSREYVEEIKPKTHEYDVLNSIITDEITQALNSNDYKQNGEYMHYVLFDNRTDKSRQKILQRLK